MKWEYEVSLKGIIGEQCGAGAVKLKSMNNSLLWSFIWMDLNVHVECYIFSWLVFALT